MAVNALSPIKYGKLMARVWPKVIENREEFDRYVALMKEFDRRADHTKLDPEEETLLALLEQLVKDYDDQIELPAVAPDAVIRFLMERKGLRQADLLPVFGSRSIASDVVGGRQEPTKAHVRKLAEFFHVSPEVFL